MAVNLWSVFNLLSHPSPFLRTTVMSASVIEMNRAHSPCVSGWRIKYKSLMLTSATPDPTTWSTSDTGTLVHLVLLIFYIPAWSLFLCSFSSTVKAPVLSASSTLQQLHLLFSSNIFHVIIFISIYFNRWIASWGVRTGVHKYVPCS